MQTICLCCLYRTLGVWGGCPIGSNHKQCFHFRKKDKVAIVLPWSWTVAASLVLCCVALYCVVLHLWWGDTASASPACLAYSKGTEQIPVTNLRAELGLRTPSATRQERGAGHGSGNVAGGVRLWLTEQSGVRRRLGHGGLVGSVFSKQFDQLLINTH